MGSLLARSAAALLALGAAQPAAAQGFDRARWVADYDQLKDSITRRSPNLEWAAERGVDLPALDARARARLAAAGDDAAARVALERFVRSFGDGHMELSWPSPASAGADAAAQQRSTCAALGYRDDADGQAIAPRLPGFTPVGTAEGPVRSGTVPVARRKLGVLRIPLFAPSAQVCERVLAERRLAPDAPCDAACADAVSRRADQLFIDDIAARLLALDRAGAELLLLDLAGNGGGNDSSIALARMVGGADVPTPELAVVRTPERLKDLAEDEAAVRAGPPQATAAQRALAASLGQAIARARAGAARPCDLSPLWRGERPGCTNLIRGLFHAGGLLAVDPANTLPPSEWAETVSATARFRYTPGLWTKPVLVLVDGDSASSTELIAAML